MKLVTLGMFCAAFAIVFTTVPVLKAQKSNGTPAAPVPAQIITSTKVFISNAGADSTSLTALRNAEEPDQPYNELYAAMKSWGRYELVAAPADADLVFEIRFTAPLTDCGKVTTYGPQVELAILDTKTHFRLWTLTEPVQGAFRKATWEKNVNQGITSLVNDVKGLSAQTSAAAGTPGK